MKIRNDFTVEEIQVMTHLGLLSLMIPVAVAKDVLGKDFEKGA